jgi:hypothetical protein
MLHLSASKQARERIAYAAMSLLIVWHTGAMVVAPAPDSVMTLTLRRLFQPYLTLFAIDNNWAFFAPNVRAGALLRYVVEDAAGQRYSFAPSVELSRFNPTTLWFKDRDQAILDYPVAYADAAGASLCRRHAALHPVTVTLLRVEQKEYWPKDRLSGKQILDPEFVDVEPLKTVSCPSK